MSRTILAIDPGPTESGVVLAEWPFRLKASLQLPNWSVLEQIGRVQADMLVIERVESMGMAVGADVFETVFWSGRFAEHCELYPFERVTRRQVKLHLCGSMRAKDANIRQALIDKLGPVGRKADPGPLYGVSGHAWAALAVLVTYAEIVAPRDSAGLVGATRTATK